MSQKRKKQIPKNRGKSPNTVRKHLRGLRNLVDTSPDPVVRRVAYAMETAIRWATEETVGWDTMAEDAQAQAICLRTEMSVELKKACDAIARTITHPELD